MLGSVRKVMIAGGGNIGAQVAAALEGGCQVKLLERNAERARQVATRFSSAIVLHGEATDETLLAQESIEEIELFLSRTNDDEDNIISASLAKRLGCKRVLALINRRAYAIMVQDGPIDIGISPAQVSIGSLQKQVRRGNVVIVLSLRRGKEADVVQREGFFVDEVRNKVIIPHHDTVIEPEDHVIVFCMRRWQVTEVEKLFQVSAGFL